MFITKGFIEKVKIFLTALELYDTYDLDKKKLEERFYSYCLRCDTLADLKDLTKRYRFINTRFNRVLRLFKNEDQRAAYNALFVELPYKLLAEAPLNQTVITNFLSFNYKNYKIISSDNLIDVKPVKGFYKINPYSSLKMKIKYTNILIYEHDELKYTINYKKMKGFEFMTSDNIEVYHKNETFYIQDKTYDQSYLMGSFKSKESLRAGFSFAILKIEKEPELVTLITLGVVGIINLKKALAASAV